MQALSRIGKGATTLEVRLLGQDGMPMQDHSYQLFAMTAPSVQDVQAAMQKARDPASCQNY